MAYLTKTNCSVCGKEHSQPVDKFCSMCPSCEKEKEDRKIADIAKDKTLEERVSNIERQLYFLSKNQHSHATYG